jgi:hypothetical protein
MGDGQREALHHLRWAQDPVRERYLLDVSKSEYVIWDGKDLAAIQILTGGRRGINDTALAELIAAGLPSR